jgi:uncharacterized FAD-dependent dehydrogenase
MSMLGCPIYSSCRELRPCEFFNLDSKSCFRPHQSRLKPKPCRAVAGSERSERSKPHQRRKTRGGGNQSSFGNASKNTAAPYSPPAADETYRLFNVKVPFTEDPGKDDYSLHQKLIEIVSKKLSIKNLESSSSLPTDAITLVRKSFDARKINQKAWVYVVDVEGAAVKAAGGRRPVEQLGQVEIMSSKSNDIATTPPPPTRTFNEDKSINRKDPVVVVGSGPAGLFAALAIAEAGLPVIMLERGQPVDVRGRDIGALMVRRLLNPENNLCYGEGGAGTWSDGKLTTRIGRNEDPVRYVLQVLYELGAPESVLVAGKPHLGTDRLVRILRAFRERLLSLNAEIRFGTRMTELIVENNTVKGVKLADGSELKASKVVLAVGHSARDIYKHLYNLEVAMTPKPFSMGFRIEHPQTLIDSLQYGQTDAEELVLRGKGPIPVAEYRLAANFEDTVITSNNNSSGSDKITTNSSSRGIYSFCMCPGGQIVPTSTDAELLCINGMSFSRRDSKWANSALVSTVAENDWSHLVGEHKELAGMALQREIELEAARRGGGQFVAPVQRVADFLENKISTKDSLPSSSYRLGTKSSSLHKLYSESMTEAIKKALIRFEKQMPGFASSPLALLHAAETRTSAPVRIDRGADTQSLTLRGLHPSGEGAGYAGGIVSSAVDGLHVGRQIVAELTGRSDVLVGEGKAYSAVKGGY